MQYTKFKLKFYYEKNKYEDTYFILHIILLWKKNLFLFSFHGGDEETETQGS